MNDGMTVKKVIAVVPSAGAGRRFGSGTNKPFASLKGKPLIIWTLEALGAASCIREIIPVVREADLDFFAEILDEYRMPKVRRIVPGGKERQDSVFNGLRTIDGKNSIVLVHDGARPLIDPAFINEAVKQLEGYDGVVAGVPVKDTIKEVGGGIIGRTLQRDVLWAVQTPQIFPYEKIYDAYQKAKLESFCATDDSSLVERYGGRVKMVMGSYANIKITTPEDLQIAEVLLKQKEDNT